MNALLALPFLVRVLLALGVAAVISYLATPYVKKLAFKIGAVDVPKDNRRMHKKPIPRLGGLAIVIAFLLCTFLFVKLEKSDNFDDFMEYEMADGWIQLKDEQGNDVEGVYYRLVPEGNGVDNMVYEVIKDNEVTVKGSVTKEMLNALDPEGEDANYPTLTVTGYAVQYSGFEPEVSEGATEPTADQIDEAAMKAWDQILLEETPEETNP